MDIKSVIMAAAVVVVFCAVTCILVWGPILLCCGDSRLKTPAMIDYRNYYDFGCCARCRSKAAVYLANGQIKEAGETCGLYNPGWRWKGKQK